jgi:hypothetical protein
MNENTFKQYIYENICQCPEQCLPDNYQIKNQTNCKEITPLKNIDNINFFDDKIKEVLDYFTTSNILLKVGNKYYIIASENKLKLSWDNIKSLHDENVQKLLWLLRKCVVDLILKKIIFELQLDKKENFKIFSVGSNNLSSDYDITLYGNTLDKGTVITLFEKEFKKFFYEHSSIVFDTNIYGKSFISFEKDELSTKFICNDNETIYVLKQASENSQLTWALIKYFQDIRNGLGDNMFNSMVNFLITNVDIPHIVIAYETRIYLNNKDTELINYNNLFSEKFEKGFLKEYSNNILLGTSDYTSLVNFYGSETYFTRGTFLDIVVNKQMCQNSIELQDIDYISSILENSGFFFLHNNKTKYFIRVVNTLDILIQTDRYKILEFSTEFEQIKKIFNDIKSIDEKGKVSYDKKYCQWIDEKTFDLLKCEKYTIFNLLLKINYEILNIFSYFYKSITQKNIIEKETFQFYYKFVKSNTKVLGNQIELEKPHVKKILKRSRRKIKSQSNRLPKLDETYLGSESNLVNPELSLMSSLAYDSSGSPVSMSPVSGSRSPVSVSPRISISTLANKT